MTFRSMEIFQAVVENKSMQAAARILFISVPSVSEVISDLEEEFNQKLFERLNHKLFITPSGQRLYDYVTRILNLQRELQQQMNSENSVHALRIGATVSIGSSIIFPILQKAKPLNANVIINNTKNIEEKLLRNELDIALVEGKIHNKYLISKPLVEDELVVACNPLHPFSGQESVSWAELESCPLLVREEGSGTREKLTEAFEKNGIKPNIQWESSCINAIIKAVSDGLGVTVISKRLISAELKTLKIDGFDGKRMFSLVWHKDKYFSDAMEGFITACYQFSKEEN